MPPPWKPSAPGGAPRKLKQRVAAPPRERKADPTLAYGAGREAAKRTVRPNAQVVMVGQAGSRHRPAEMGSPRPPSGGGRGVAPPVANLAPPPMHTAPIELVAREVPRPFRWMPWWQRAQAVAAHDRRVRLSSAGAVNPVKTTAAGLTAGVVLTAAGQSVNVVRTATAALTAGAVQAAAHSLAPQMTAVGTYVDATTGTITPVIPGSADDGTVLLSFCWVRATATAATLSGTGWTQIGSAISGSSGTFYLAVSDGTNTTDPVWTIGAATVAVTTRWKGLNKDSVQIVDNIGTVHAAGSVTDFGPYTTTGRITPANERGVFLIIAKRWDNTASGCTAPSTTDGLTWSTPEFHNVPTRTVQTAITYAAWSGGAPTPDTTYTMVCTGSPAAIGTFGWFVTLKST